jgi:hypothetical protein
MKGIYIYILIGVMALAVGGLALFCGAAKKLEVRTDKDLYAVATSLIVNIKNDLGQTICFSSCYPYRLERIQPDGDKWIGYEYGDCPKKDEVAACIDKNGSKKFQLQLDEAEPGTHRLEIAACTACSVGEPFKAEKVFYSNSFQIK